MNILFLVVAAVLPGFTFAVFNLRNVIYPRPRIYRVRNHTMARSLGDNYVLDFVGLVNQHGYPGEAHRVTTDDGYKLLLHRIPYSPASPARDGKPVVYLQHGILGSSDHFVLLGPGKDLAYLLADAGYDVWVGNLRGNTYCRAHQDLSAEEPEFWKFSFHELGVMDVRANVDYILAKTHQKDLVYVGHSMGTTVSYILLSEMPEYNEKMRLVISLAPIAYWRHVPIEVFQFAIKYRKLIQHFIESTSLFEIGAQTQDNYRVAKALCSDGAPTQPACIKLIFLLSGTDYEQLNSTMLPYFSKYYPAGASSKSFFHYIQHMLTQNFQKYDYGYVENYQRYGTKAPPQYNVKAITAPVALIYGAVDVLSSEVDVAELSRRLPNVAEFTRVPYNNWTHLDFLWANDAKTILYDSLLDLIRKYSPVN